ncbi:TIGR02391 family protein [candidate division WWE3 bacterium RIFCSPHIGHO2_01_FULL_42_13]|uniref:TIGR02391 family protein n=1 Tax=candidate division WWE3 bacterium RIFCSPHIGHO2_01_FULL_42_13 TaxID=1802617 RepID=A0A1F4UR83_UNCKA|nr:MAG: TIGR02391 family protein [candidate division WWE3 bacterium RIFCSPHIGHO2_01_FULL_42_13]
MATLSTNEKQVLEKLFQMGGGYVLNFSDRTMGEFFRDDVGIDIYSKKYIYGSGSKANRLRGLWLTADGKIIGKTVLKLIEYIENQILIDNLKKEDFPVDRMTAGKEIGEHLLGKKTDKKENKSQATFKDGNINIVLQKDIFDHVQKLLNNGHYFNAVEEAYKVVRKKLKDVSGKEKATDAFSASNYEKIFGHQPTNDAESDFFEGVKFLHMAIQFLRNEKAHTPANDLDKNLAIHYIALASLAYDLINRK